MDRPNILIIMADQMTYALTGAYGHPVVRTPALERLAGEGVRFDAAYTPCPLCTPARSAMLSGRYVSRTRTYDNGAILPADVPTWAHHLRAGGYECVASGKLHLVGADQLHGFERRLTPDIYPADFSWTPQDEDYAAPEEVSGRKARDARAAGACDWSDQLSYDENVHLRALEFLRARRPGRRREPPVPDLHGRSAGGQRPFCLLVSYTHPHPPFLALRRLWNAYEGAPIDLPPDRNLPAEQRSLMERWLHGFQGLSPADADDEEFLRRLHRAYYAMITYVDEKVAELLEALETFSLRDNTAVFFLSDHGEMLGRRRQVQKRLFFEWSARVPLIASFPGRWPAGRRVNTPVSMLDLFGTLTDLAGLPTPTDLDGHSLSGLLTGQEPDSGDRVVVLSEYHGEGVPVPCFMARRGSFKYIYAHGHERQLFDLTRDGDELHNLAGRSNLAEVESELHAAILERFDPDAIAEDMIRSREQRRLMHRAMQQGAPTRWDYRP